MVTRALEAQPSRVAARLWPEVAGEQLAARTWVSSVRGDTMFIVATSSVWAHQLQMMEQDLVARLRDRAGEDCPIHRLRFRAGGRPDPGDAVGTAPCASAAAVGPRQIAPEIGPETAAAAKRAAGAVADDALSKAIERALRVQELPPARPPRRPGPPRGD